MKRIEGKDWLILILDIIIVNLSYYSALVLRFFLGSEFRFNSFEEMGYPIQFLKFAPIYTIFCIAIFFVFRLYNGVWKYAGVNDINRIIRASLVTAAFYVVGTLVLFESRFPISVYFMGAVLQFVGITFIRFAYRLWLVEKRIYKNRHKSGKNTLIIGAGEAVGRVIRELEDGSRYRPVCVVDARETTYERVMNGMPVYGGLDQLETIFKKYVIKYVFIVDPILQPETKAAIEELCKEKRIGLKDFGYSFYLGWDDALEEQREVNTAEPEKKMIPFSPPDISELEIGEVKEALESGWITTGPRTKLLERRLAAFIETGRVDIDVDAETEIETNADETGSGDSISADQLSDHGSSSESGAASAKHRVTVGPEYWRDRVVCLSSCTAAEELNLRILGIHEGDEVIVPAYTYTATASAAIHCGATVKFIDIQKDGDPTTRMPEMDYDALVAAITPKTKAIVAVDLAGIPADYDRIYEIVNKKRDMFTPLEPDGTLQGDLAAKIQQGIGTVAVMADCAHGLGASRVVKHVPGGSNGVILTAIGTDAGILETATDTANSAGVQTTAAGTSAGVSATAANQTSTGRLAHFTSFSFHAVKNFTTAEGGAATWCLPQSVYDLGVTDAEIYKMYQLMSLHGQSKDALAKTNVGAWEYDIVGPWYKCNMTDIMAAIGLKQLDRYPGLLDRRKQIIKKYDKTCDELGLDHLTHHADGIDSSNHLYLVRIPGGGEEQRNDIIKKMAENGVSTNVHYKPLPMMTAYRELGHDIADFPNAYDYYHNLFTLPLHTLLTDEDVERVRVALRVAISE